MAVPTLWTPAAAEVPPYAVITGPAGLYGDYAPVGTRSEASNLIRDVLSCGLKRIEVIQDADVTDGLLFEIRVRKDKWFEAAKPCLKKTLPEGFEITDDRTVED